jgi:hypothetical protein
LRRPRKVTVQDGRRRSSAADSKLIQTGSESSPAGNLTRSLPVRIGVGFAIRAAYVSQGMCGVDVKGARAPMLCWLTTRDDDEDLAGFAAKRLLPVVQQYGDPQTAKACEPLRQEISYLRQRVAALEREQ